MNAISMLGLWVTISGCLLLVAEWNHLIAWADLNPNMASWVQAFGSIGAIAAAGWGIYWGQMRQEHRQAEAEKARKIELLNTAFQLVHGAAEILKKMCDDEDNISTPVPVDLMTLQGQFDGLSHALRKIDLTTFGNFKVIEAVVTTDSVMRKMTLLLSFIREKDASIMLEWLGVQGEAVEAYSIVKERASSLAATLDQNKQNR